MILTDRYSDLRDLYWPDNALSNLIMKLSVLFPMNLSILLSDSSKKQLKANGKLLGSTLFASNNFHKIFICLLETIFCSTRELSVNNFKI